MLQWRLKNSDPKRATCIFESSLGRTYLDTLSTFEVHRRGSRDQPPQTSRMRCLSLSFQNTNFLSIVHPNLSTEKTSHHRPIHGSLTYLGICLLPWSFFSSKVNTSSLVHNIVIYPSPGPAGQLAMPSLSSSQRSQVNAVVALRHIQVCIVPTLYYTFHQQQPLSTLHHFPQSHSLRHHDFRAISIYEENPRSVDLRLDVNIFNQNASTESRSASSYDAVGL